MLIVQATQIVASLTVSIYDRNMFTVEATGDVTQGNVAVGSFVFLTKVVAPLICYNVCAIKLSLKSSLFSHQGQFYKTFTVVTSWPEDTCSLV